MLSVEVRFSKLQTVQQIASWTPWDCFRAQNELNGFLLIEDHVTKLLTGLALVVPDHVGAGDIPELTEVLY